MLLAYAAAAASWTRVLTVPSIKDGTGFIGEIIVLVDVTIEKAAALLRVPPDAATLYRQRPLVPLVLTVVAAATEAIAFAYTTIGSLGVACVQNSIPRHCALPATALPAPFKRSARFFAPRHPVPLHVLTHLEAKPGILPATRTAVSFF